MGGKNGRDINGPCPAQNQSDSGKPFVELAGNIRSFLTISSELLEWENFDPTMSVEHTLDITKPYSQQSRKTSYFTRGDSKKWTRPSEQYSSLPETQSDLFTSLRAHFAVILLR